jgi:Ca2+-binding RTX toxin-like protein
MLEALERRTLLAATPLGNWGVTYQIVGATLVIEGTESGEQVNIDDESSGDLLLYATDGTDAALATVPAADVVLIVVRLYGGDDVLDAATLELIPRAVHAWGGAGGDVLWGSAGDDHLHGGEGDDDLAGGPGNDKLFGGSGQNVLDGGEGKDILIP